MARSKGNQNQNQNAEVPTKAEVAKEVATLAAKAQRGDLENRIKIAEILDGRGAAYTVGEIAKLARGVFSRKDGYGTVSGLSEPALSKYQKVYRQFIVSGITDLSYLKSINAKMEKLHAWADEPEAVRREFVQDYARKGSTPNGQRTRDRGTINVNKDVLARFLAMKNVFGLSDDLDNDRGALHDAIMTAVLDHVEAHPPAPPAGTSESDEHASVTN